jgi:hypothetical protein
MRWTLVALALLLSVTSIRAGSPDDAKRKAELAWARRIAVDFLETATNIDGTQTRPVEALGLLTPELARGLQDDKGWNWLDSLAHYVHGPQISTEELAPNGSEAIFTGTLKGNDGNPGRRFILRVAKESENGKWSIRFLKLLPAKEGKEKGEKPEQKKPVSDTKSPAELPATPPEKPSPEEGGDNKGMNSRSLVLVGIVVLAAFARLVPHPPNFTPIGAMALFGAAHFRNSWIGVLIPLVAMLLSDLGLEIAGHLGWLGGWMAAGSGFHLGMVYVYASIFLIGFLGLLLRRHRTVASVGATVLGSAVLFFTVTNFGVWLEGLIYPSTAEGLLACYVAAIPFFHCTLLGDAFYTTVLFGAFALAEKRYPALQTTPA